MFKLAGARKVTVIGRNQPMTEGDNATKTTRSLVNTLKGAAKAASYAIGQGKPSSSKASKAKEMDTLSEGERDVTPTQHHSSIVGEKLANTLSHEESIFECVVGWTPPNNDHLVHWDPLSGTRGEIDVETFLGCEFKAAAYTTRYDICGWILYRTFKYPNTDVYIYLPADILLEQMQLSYFLCCGLQIFLEDMRDYTVPTCVVKHLTNAGSEKNPHWILAGDANPFIPVHRIGAKDEDAEGIMYNSPEQTPYTGHEVKHEDKAEGLTEHLIAHEAKSGSPTEEARYGEAVRDWSMSPAATYRTPSIGITSIIGAVEANMEQSGRSMSPHRYLSPTPLHLTSPRQPIS
ncbi:hypothetical protein AX16_009853 [Volvariella volvacea WC 439]|nr:hypothetical protein AX16_009853 [Volvariella volvacea WC 439]